MQDNNKILIISVLFVILTSSVSAANYYIDADASGTSTTCNATAPCLSFQNMSDLKTMSAGDTLYLDNCDIHRGTYTFDDNDGSAGSMISITSNGTCSQKAKWWGSVNASRNDMWNYNGSNIWITNFSKFNYTKEVFLLAYNVNNYMNGGDASIGTRETASTDLNNNWEYFYNSTTDSVWLYLTTNPSTTGNGIELNEYDYYSGGERQLLYINAKDYVHVKNISFSFAAGAVRTQLCQYCNITDVDAKYMWLITFYLNGDGTGGAAGGRFNTIERCTLNYTGIKMNISGSSGEGIWEASMYGDNFIYNTFDRNFGVNINGFASRHSTYAYNKIMNIPYDDTTTPSMPSALYCEACNNTIMMYNNITNVMNGINIGTESTSRRTINMTVHHNTVDSVTNIINGDSGTAADANVFINVSQNSFIMTGCDSTYSNSRLFYLSDFQNTTFMNNIFYTNCVNEPGTSFVALQWVNASYPNLTSNYNLWYKTDGNWNWTTSSTTYNSLSAWQTSTFKDTNSIYDNPEFEDEASYNFEPLLNSPVCTMSSTGSYVGALPCSAGLIETLNLTNVGYALLTNDSVRINWTNPSTADYNRTHVWLNGTLIGNTSTPGNYHNLINLSPSSGYVVTLIPFDDYGNYGENETVTFTTYATNYSYPTGTSPSTLLGSVLVINFTFMQKPYFLSLNLTGNNTDPKVYDYQENAYNYTVNQELISGSWAQANDGDWTTDSTISSSEAGDAFELYHNFTNYGNYSGRDIFTNYSFRLKYGEVSSYCLNQNNGSYMPLGSNTYSLGSYTTYELSKQLHSSCLDGDSIKMKYAITNTYGSGQLLFYETMIYSRNNYSIDILDSRIFNSMNESTNTFFFNLTGYGNNMTGNILNFTFTSEYENTFYYNVSYAIVYSQSINVSVLKEDGTTVLNPACTLNGDTVYPKTSLVTFNSSEDNIITCSLAGYFDVEETLIPTYDAINLTMSTITVNISIYDEHINTLIEDYEFSLEFFNGESFNFTTTNGTIIFNGDSVGEYKFYYWTEDGTYPRRARFVNVLNLSDVDLRIYALNTTWGTYKRITIIDESGNPVVHAKVKMLRQFADCNCFRTVEEAYTDENGFVIMFPELYSATYKFQIEYEGEVKRITDETTVDTRELYVSIKLLSSGIQDFFQVATGVYAQLTYTEPTGEWSYSWIDNTGVVDSGTLQVTRKTAYGETLLFSQSSAGSTGTLTYDASAYINTTGEFTAKAFVNTTSSGERFKIAEKIKNFQSDKAVYGLTGVFMSLIVLLVLIMVGIYNPAISIALAMVGLFVTSMMGFVAISPIWLTGIIIVGLIFSLRMRT